MGMQCCGFLVTTACAARVPLPLRHVAEAAFLDCAFVHAADMSQTAWAQLQDVLQALLIRWGPPECMSVRLCRSGLAGLGNNSSMISLAYRQKQESLQQVSSIPTSAETLCLQTQDDG